MKKENYLMTCTGCDGTGKYEESFCTFGNETHYYEVNCGCENGKELDYAKINEDIKRTNEAIKELKASIVTYEKLMRQYHKNKNNVSAIAMLGLLIECEEQLEQKEELLAFLEDIENV